jgi:hypothetical protein
MDSLGVYLIRIIMVQLSLRDCRALRCASHNLSIVPLLSMKRYWFTDCVYCGVKLRKQKTKDKSSAFGNVYLMRNINLECGCRCHRNCYAIAAAYPWGTYHDCVNNHKNLLESMCLPKPVVHVIKNSPEKFQNFKKWIKYMKLQVISERRNTIVKMLTSTLVNRGAIISEQQLRAWTFAPLCIEIIQLPGPIDYKKLVAILMKSFT